MSKKPAKKASKKASTKASSGTPRKAPKNSSKSAARRAPKGTAGRAAKTSTAAKPKPGVLRQPAKAPRKATPSGRAPARVRPGSPLPAAPSDAMARRAAAFVRFAHKMLADMAAGIPDERGTAQLPGAYNHKLWTLGHMADSNQWFAWLIDGQPMTFPAEWSKLFGMGSTPADDPAMYPPLADVRAAFEASVDRLCAAVEALNDHELNAPPAGNGSGFVTDKLDSALKTAWHYGWHLGQIAALRKGLGLPAMMPG